MSKNICDMQVGEEGYVVPWCIYKYYNPADNLMLFMRGDYTAQEELNGTFRIKIKRTDEDFFTIAHNIKLDDLEVAQLNMPWSWVQARVW